MRFRVLVLFLLVAAALEAATTAGMVGYWHFLPEKSKGGQYFPVDTTLVVKQYGARMYFEYWANGRLFQRDDYRVDGKSEKQYKNTNEEVFKDSHLSKNRLQIVTHHIIENEIGPQSFDDYQTWVLSKDGNSLVFQSGDGRDLTFERQANPPTPAPPKTPATTANAPAAPPAPAKK